MRPAEDPDRGGAAHGLARSFGWAWAGLTGAAVRERNMRLHLEPDIAGAALAALSTALLPAPRPRALAGDAALAGAGVGGHALLARAADRWAGLVAAALLWAVAVGGAVRRRRSGI